MAKTRIAIISDIHGFSLALERVLADIDQHHVDKLIVAGDLVESGPDPAGVLQILQARDCVAIMGNTDSSIAERDSDSKSDTWTAKQIGKEGRNWLSNLPFDYRFSPPNGRDKVDDLLVVHANPFDFNRAIKPDADNYELDELIGDTQAGIVAFGHIHIAYIRPFRDMTLLDVSAVGNPKDGDLRSKWGLVEWDDATRSWTASLKYVDYPTDETERQIYECGMPNPEKHIAKLKRASYE